MRVACSTYPSSRWRYLIGCVALCLPTLVGWPRPVTAASELQGQLASALASRPNRANGARLFEYCARCHGEDAGGSADGTVPAIAAQAPRVLIRQLLEYRVAQRADLRMSAVAHTRHLPDAQALADVAAYIGGLPAPVRPAVAGRAERAGATAMSLAGAQYARTCAACHGAAGQGAGEAPRLAGQRYRFLLQRLTDAAAGRSLQSVHAPLLAPLAPEDLADLAAYLAQLSATAQER